ncbi:MAG: hypothetical protein FWD21_04725, partial [Peptococcaceae bacterium]|nr:hypothetical protein [Peptococcaceae bacterium]
MLFYSLEFFLLLTITLLIFYLIPARMRIYVLTLADLVFYLVTGLNYLILFAIVSLAVYFCAIKAWETNQRIYTWIGITIAVTNLLFFKYTGFILTNIGIVFPTHSLLENHVVANIILPLGISFYTFQLIAYLADVSW